MCATWVLLVYKPILVRAARIHLLKMFSKMTCPDKSAKLMFLNNIYIYYELNEITTKQG